MLATSTDTAVLRRPKRCSCPMRLQGDAGCVSDAQAGAGRNNRRPLLTDHGAACVQCDCREMPAVIHKLKKEVPASVIDASTVVQC